jgi:hypothetical protein
MEKLNTDKYSLKKFGVSMGVAFFVIALIVYARHKHSTAPWILLSGIFFASAIIRPRILKPVYIFWMGLAFVLGWINTRLILSAIFYLVLTPIGLVIRLLGKDLLDRKMDFKAASYWKDKESGAFKPADYERQF